MAITTELTPNVLEKTHQQNQLTGVLAAGVAMAGSWWLGLDFISLAVGPALYSALVDSRLRAGAKGENRALGLPETEPGSLATLPDSYVLFNNLRIPYEGKTVEIDLVAVGTNGVFIVEVKHYRGHLTGNGCGQHWTQTKTSAQGFTYTNRLRNPTGQVWRQILALRQWLGRSGYRGSIEGVVVCTHPEVVLDVVSSKIPVLTVSELAPWIQKFQPKFPQHMPYLPVPLLRQLRDGRPLPKPTGQASPREDQTRWIRDQTVDRVASIIRRRPPQPEHISNFLQRVMARHNWPRNRQALRVHQPPSTPDRPEEPS